MSEKLGNRTEPMAFSYLRVSTDGQDTEKNKTKVRAYVNEMGFPKVEFFEEKISGKIPWKKRQIKDLIDTLQEGDKLI